jgi:CheY-like chemotaxis protein
MEEDFCAEHHGFVPGKYVMFSVSDTGIGMDRETLSKIFEPFFTTKEMGKGTGLGLATVYGIVKQNNGFIDVYSEPGEGAIFKIYLPVHEEKPVHTSGECSPEVMKRGSETILLVEDEPMILKLSKTILDRLGYKVLSAGSPREALRLADQHEGKIHLLITDVVMPEMNGRDLAKKLISRYPDIKLLFMSGYTADIIANRGVLDEGVNFIQKPFSINDMATKIREMLSEN